jgi:hypothetical protein
MEGVNMTTQKLIDVMLCVNNRYGTQLSRVTGIQIGYGDRIKLDGRQPFKLGKSGFRIGNLAMPFERYNTLVGNIFWDCAWIDCRFVPGLLVYLHSTEKWTLEEAPTEIFNQWQTEWPTFYIKEFFEEAVSL